MTLARLVPFQIHGALETLLASVTMAAPFVLGFQPPAAVASVTIGVLILAVALATHAGEESALPISTHAGFDALFAAAMALSAIAFGLSGDAAAGAFLGAGALALILLVSLTRYSPGHA